MIKTIIKVDIDELNKMIDEWYMMTTYSCFKIPYIFANEWTLRQISKECCADYRYTDMKPGKLKTYHGCPVFEYDELKDGQIELR